MALLEAVKSGNLAFVRKNIKNIDVNDSKWIDYTLLNEAIDSKQSKVAQFLIRKNFRIHKPSKTRCQETLLHKAVMLKDLDLIKLLLKKDAPVDVKDKDGNTPILLAAINYTNRDVVDSIMKSLMIDKAVTGIYKHGTSYLHVACMSSCTQVVEKLLKLNCSVKLQVKSTSPYWPGFTPLHFSVKYGTTETVQLLLKKGAIPNVADAKKDTPLHLAFKEHKHDIVKSMLAVVKTENFVNTEGLSYFHIACSQNFSLIQDMLQQNININSQISNSSSCYPGSTALHIAVTFDCYEITKKLLDNGASSDIKDKNGLTPLHIAFHSRKDTLVDLILLNYNECHKNPADKNGLTHFHIACSRDNAKLIEKFIKAGVPIDVKISDDSKLLPGYSPLHIATLYKRLENIKVLLVHNASVNLKEAQGQIPLHLICQGSDKSLYELKNLINGCLINSQNSKLDLALSKTNLFAILSLLLDYSSNVNAQDNFGKLPLFYLYDEQYQENLFNMFDALTTSNENKSEEILEHVLQIRRTLVFTFLWYNIDLNLQDNNGWSMMHYVANVNSKLQSFESEMINLFVLHHGASVDVKNNKNQTPLLLAIRKGHLGFAELFLHLCQNVDVAENETLCTPIHELLKGEDNFRFFEIQKSLKVLTTLINQGANVNRQDELGNTPLHYVTHGSADPVDLLLAHGADINIKNNNGKTPLDCTSMWRCNHVNYAYSNHIVKLKEIGYTFGQQNELFPNKVANLLDVNLCSKRYYTQQECSDELERLKLVNIDVYTSLYDILFKSAQQMIHYVNSTNLKELLIESGDIQEEFPIYESVMRSQYRIGQTRYPLVKPVVSALRNFSNSKLTNPCCEMIMDYLSNEQLKNLIKAAQLADDDETDCSSCATHQRLSNGKRVKLN